MPAGLEPRSTQPPSARGAPLHARPAEWRRSPFAAWRHRGSAAPPPPPQQGACSAAGLALRDTARRDQELWHPPLTQAMTGPKSTVASLITIYSNTMCAAIAETAELMSTCLGRRSGWVAGGLWGQRHPEDAPLRPTAQPPWCHGSMAAVMSTIRVTAGPQRCRPRLPREYGRVSAAGGPADRESGIARAG